jgi:hypothetical protein
MADAFEQEIDALRRRLEAIETALIDDKTMLARHIIEDLAINARLMREIESSINELLARVGAASGQLDGIQPEPAGMAGGRDPSEPAGS